MPLSRCTQCNELSALGKEFCAHCGYIKSVPTPKSVTSVPFLLTLAVVLALGFHILSSRSYGPSCDSADSLFIDDSLYWEEYCQVR